MICIRMNGIQSFVIVLFLFSGFSFWQRHKHIAFLLADGPTTMYDNLCVSKRVCNSMQPWVHYIVPPALGSGRLTCAWNLGAQSPALCNQVHLWDSDCEIVLVQSWAAGLRRWPVTNDFHPSLQWPKSLMGPHAAGPGYTWVPSFECWLHHYFFVLWNKYSCFFQL